MKILPQVNAEMAIQMNLKTFSFELGTNFETLSQEAVERMDALALVKRVIDLGCGDGAATKHFLLKGWGVRAVDVNPDKLNLVSKQARHICLDIHSYLKNLPTASVDNIFCHHCLEHLANPEEVLSEMGRVLRPGGLAYIAVPAEDHPHSVHVVAFDRPEELIPPLCEAIVNETRGDVIKEYVVISRKL